MRIPDDHLNAMEYSPKDTLNNRRRLTALRPFPSVLYDVLERAEYDPSYRSILSWEPNGRSFIIYDRDRFCNDLMPQHFSFQTQLASFQRQLNLYGFRRISPRGSDALVYCHKDFNRASRDRCSSLQRSSRHFRHECGKLQQLETTQLEDSVSTSDKGGISRDRQQHRKPLVAGLDSSVVGGGQERTVRTTAGDDSGTLGLARINLPRIPTAQSVSDVHGPAVSYEVSNFMMQPCENMLQKVGGATPSQPNHRHEQRAVQHSFTTWNAAMSASVFPRRDSALSYDMNPHQITQPTASPVFQEITTAMDWLQQQAFDRGSIFSSRVSPRQSHETVIENQPSRILSTMRGGSSAKHDPQCGSLLGNNCPARSRFPNGEKGSVYDSFRSPPQLQQIQLDTRYKREKEKAHAPSKQHSALSPLSCEFNLSKTLMRRHRNQRSESTRKPISFPHQMANISGPYGNVNLSVREGESHQKSATPSIDALRMQDEIEVAVRMLSPQDNRVRTTRDSKKESNHDSLKERLKSDGEDQDSDNPTRSDAFAGRHGTRALASNMMREQSKCHGTEFIDIYDHEEEPDGDMVAFLDDVDLEG